MSPRYFTAEEANDALQDVRPLTEELVEHRRALVELQEVAGIARCVARIHEAGALVKDLDEGLVDFPARREGEDVLLCWRLGEEEIGYWHGLEEGFSGRKPLPL